MVIGNHGAFGLVVVALLCGCSSHHTDSERSSLPGGLRAGKVISGSIDRNLAFQEGVVIFELPETTARQLKYGGVAVLRLMLQNAGGARAKYSAWQETPALRPDDYRDIHSGKPVRALSALNCSRGKAGSFRDNYSLCAALTSPGNYYSMRGDEEIVIVMPRQKLIAYAICDQ